MTAEGLLYVWGNNDLGQLGLESETSVLEPKLCLEEKRFHFVAAGQQHSAFITGKMSIYILYSCLMVQQYKNYSAQESHRAH